MTFVLFCLAGEEDGNREGGAVEMEVQSEKSRHTAVGPEEWDGPSKRSLHITLLDFQGHLVELLLFKTI